MLFSRVRVKMCGFTKEADVIDAVRLGADAVGFVFYEPSKRFVDIETAVKLRHAVPAFVSSVALFVNPEAALVHDVIKQVKPDLLQFHGDETAEFCDSFGHPYIKAFRVGGPDSSSADQVLDNCLPYGSAKGWLFDSFSPHYGGTGVRLELSLLSGVQAYCSEHAMPLILAGGLNEQNVAQALEDIHPYAVDVSSGIESAPGLKKAEKMQAFLQSASSQ